MKSMNVPKTLSEHGVAKGFNITRLKLSLLLSFSILILFQFVVGFRDLEDYLVVFIFVLFLNDQYFKSSKIQLPEHTQSHKNRMMRIVMSVVVLLLFLVPLLLDFINVSNAARLIIYKIAFLLWAQIFLLDSFFLYKKTYSRQWLLFANMAAILLIIGAFISH